VTDRLDAQFAFLNEADRLKSVLRATTLVDGSRPENSGEHSWHLALYALILADQADPDVRIDRVIRMLILHDLVEIDVGDVPIHSANGLAHASADTAEAESRAADRIFGLLPPDLGAELRALWEEFEAAATPDAAFVPELAPKKVAVLARLFAFHCPSTVSAAATRTRENTTKANTATGGIRARGRTVKRMSVLS
jgi:putative hydrolase of HD superfamily